MPSSKSTRPTPRSLDTGIDQGPRLNRFERNFRQNRVDKTPRRHYSARKIWSSATSEETSVEGNVSDDKDNDNDDDVPIHVSETFFASPYISMGVSYASYLSTFKTETPKKTDTGTDTDTPIINTWEDLVAEGQRIRVGPPRLPNNTGAGAAKGTI